MHVCTKKHNHLKVEWTGVYQVPLLGAMIQTGLVLLCSLVAIRDRFLVRIMCSVLGMHVRQKDPLSRDKNTKLYICNHVTEFDHNLLNLLTPCSTVSV